MDINGLIKRCVKKDRKAQETLYNLYKAKLFPVCLKYCSTHTEAQDHLHDTFITIFSSIKKYKAAGSFEGWMKRIAINTAIDRYKKNTRFELTEAKLAKLSEPVYLEEDIPLIPLDTLLQCIHQLPNQYRNIFNLYELDNYSHKEIAQLLSISESSSKSNLHRAKAILKKQVGGLIKKKQYKADADGK